MMVFILEVVAIFFDLADNLIMYTASFAVWL